MASIPTQFGNRRETRRGPSAEVESQAGTYLENEILSWRERERDWRLVVRVKVCITHLANTTREPIGLALAATRLWVSASQHGASQAKPARREPAQTKPH